MFTDILAALHEALDEEAKRLLPWNKPDKGKLKEIEQKLRAMGMKKTTSPKLISRGPFNAPEQPIRTGKAHTS